MDLASKKILYEAKDTQEAAHNAYGGVVPELASRLHTANLPGIIASAREFFPSLKAVAVTNEPGLVLSLAQGVMAAKALAVGLNLPLLPIHHIKGHVFSCFIGQECFYPLSALVVSGGHTSILTLKSYTDVTENAATLDDSLGESFDKTAKMLDLGYPGGAAVEALAKNGDENAHNFSIPLKNKKILAFSYSGLKNAVRLAVSGSSQAAQSEQSARADIAASFQKAAVAHVLDKCELFFKAKRPKNFALVGGVSANLYLRSKLAVLCDAFGVRLILPQLKYTSDNAAMIARAACEAYALGLFATDLGVEINSRKPFRREND